MVQYAALWQSFESRGLCGAPPDPLMSPGGIRVVALLLNLAVVTY